MVMGLAGQAGILAAKAVVKKVTAKKSKTVSTGKRHRRRGLTQKRKSDLLWLRNNIGKTAAANYLSNHSI